MLSFLRHVYSNILSYCDISTSHYFNYMILFFVNSDFYRAVHLTPVEDSGSNRDSAIHPEAEFRCCSLACYNTPACLIFHSPACHANQTQSANQSRMVDLCLKGESLRFGWSHTNNNIQDGWRLLQTSLVKWSFFMGLLFSHSFALRIYSSTLKIQTEKTCFSKFWPSADV